MNKKILIPYILFYFIFVAYFFTKSGAHSKVHDNSLYFTHDAHSVIFTPESHCITLGQSYRTPDGRQAQKKSHRVGIDIKAGRHGSLYVIDCVRNMFADASITDPFENKFTFFGPPKELNFAVKGKLTIDGKTFEHIILAQGRSGASNNWWFGGTNCLNPLFDTKDKDQVNCTATDKTKWCFIRGLTGSVSHTRYDHIKVEKHQCSDA